MPAIVDLVPTCAVYDYIWYLQPIEDEVEEEDAEEEEAAPSQEEDGSLDEGGASLSDETGETRRKSPRKRKPRKDW